MSTTERQRFETYQRRYREAYQAWREQRYAMGQKYGPGGENCCWATKGERQRMERLSSHVDKCGSLVIAWVVENSPRGVMWRRGAPYHWICSQLSYADAMTAGALSVVPPLCYGQSERERAAFGAALEVAA